MLVKSFFSKVTLSQFKTSSKISSEILSEAIYDSHPVRMLQNVI